MGKIFCLMGKSSSGKDTIYKELMENEELGLKRMVPYTTRPIRVGETEGVEYHFTDEAGYQELLEAGRIIEARAYDTVHGVWRYFTVKEDTLDLSKDNYCLIGTLEVYTKIRDYFGPEKVLPLLVEVDDGVRLERAVQRERRQSNPKYEELCRRFLADSKDFSPEKIAQADIKKTFYNNFLAECLEEIATYIKENS